MDISAPVSKLGNRPRMLMCYLCGREFGSKSLPIHIPQCQKKWLAEEENKPKKERRPLPPPPTSEQPIKTTGAQAIDDFNSEAFAAFEQSLEQCPHCQRRFVPKAFKHHSNACNASHPAKPAGTGLIANSLSNRLVPGAIAGSMHGNAKATPPKLQKNIGLYRSSMKEKIMDMRSQRDGNISSPSTIDHGQSSKSSSFCDECGAQYERPNSKFCSQCGTKRAGFTMVDEPKINSQNREPPTLSAVPTQKLEGNSKPKLLNPWKINKDDRIDNDVPVEVKIKMTVPKKEFH